MNIRYVMLFSGIVFISAIIKLWPVSQNNFYFTVDQGQNAVAVREILIGHQLTLRGPETSIRGIYAGPLWYYFLATGYFLFCCAPRGAVVMMILLNTLTLGFVIWWISHRVNKKSGLLVGLGLTFFWPFYETSAWAFNAFPVVSLGLFCIYFIGRYLRGENKCLTYAFLVSFLAFNADLASAAVLWLFVGLVGFWGVYRKQTSGKQYIFLVSIPIVFGVVTNGRAVLDLAIKSVSMGDGASGLGVFKGTNFENVARAFLNILGSSAIPQLPGWGSLLVALLVFLVGRLSSRNSFISLYLKLLGILWILSFVFFSFNRGWKDWHTVYLPPLTFIGIVLILLLKSKALIYRLLLVVVFISQFQYFFFRYSNFPGKEGDQGIIANRYRVIDRIYDEAQGQGFAVFTYTKGYFDYPQQYLFWWYGRPRYGYLPCEYANLPGTDKSEYVPRALSYLLPKKECSKQVFLMMESDTNGETNKDWVVDYRGVTRLVESVSVGGVVVEQRELTKESDMLFDTNVYLQDYWDGPLHLMIPNNWKIEHVGDYTKARYGDLFVLEAEKMRKGCHSRLEITQIIGVNADKRVIDISGNRVVLTSAFLPKKDQRGGGMLEAVLFEGEQNDYYVRLYRGGNLTNAGNLANRIFQSIKIVEDSGTQVIKNCGVK